MERTAAAALGFILLSCVVLNHHLIIHKATEQLDASMGGYNSKSNWAVPGSNREQKCKPNQKGARGELDGSVDVDGLKKGMWMRLRKAFADNI